jgi:hypothetical protein
MDVTTVTFKVLDGLGNSGSDVQFYLPSFKLMFRPSVLIISVFPL